jgi:hypothetical protein
MCALKTRATPTSKKKAQPIRYHPGRRIGFAIVKTIGGALNTTKIHPNIAEGAIPALERCAMFWWDNLIPFGVNTVDLTNLPGAFLSNTGVVVDNYERVSPFES